MTKRILYIQHTGEIGGSAMSLLYLLQGLDRTKYEPIVACIHPSDSVINLYRDIGIEAFYYPGILPFAHTTGGWGAIYNPNACGRTIKQLLGFQKSVSATKALIAKVKPDLVHLNSLILPSSAVGIKQAGIPLVWQVRESVHPGHFGLRKRWLSSLYRQLADAAIFISEDNRQQLVDGKIGVVIPNFVDFQRFDASIDGLTTRKELGFSPDTKVILFLGGRSTIKGIFPLLTAMPLVKKQVPDVHLLIGAGAYHFSGRIISRIARAILPLLGSGTEAQRVDKMMEKHQLYDYVHLLEWRSDLPQLLAASDVLTFPSTAPHFARPVIEAGAMSKPVIASRIGGVEELVEDGKTGYLVSPDNPKELAESLIRVLTNDSLRQAMGQQGLKRAKRLYNAQTNINLIIVIYEKLLNI